MKNIFLLILLIVCIHPLSGQNRHYIIAGKVSSNDSLYINNLSLNVQLAYPPHYDSTDIDINKDNVNDIRLISFSSYGSGAKSSYGCLKSINNNAFYSFNNGSAGINYLVKKIEFGDTIDNKLNWNGSKGYLSYWSWTPPGDTWTLGEWNNQYGYVGLRIILSSDTIYGWVHMLVQNDGTNIQIDSCAFQKKTLQSVYNYNLNLTSVFPIPTKDKIILKTSQPIKENSLIILNVKGQELIRQKIVNTLTQIDVGNLPNGIYFLKLISNNKVEVRKIIKE